MKNKYYKIQTMDNAMGKPVMCVHRSLLPPQICTGPRVYFWPSRVTLNFWDIKIIMHKLKFQGANLYPPNKVEEEEAYK